MAKDPRGDAPAEKNKGGRPPHQPTGQQRATVKLMAGHLIPHNDIALAIGISKDTLYAHYREELDPARALYKLEVARAVGVHLMGRPAQYNAEGRLIRAEIPPDRSMAIFQAKVVLGQQEVSRVVHVFSPEQLASLTDDEFTVYSRIIEKIASLELGGEAPRGSTTSH